MFILSSISPAGANRRLLLRPGHQPAAGRFPAGHRSHSIHWDPWPHDLRDLVRLQRLLRGLRRHQERTTEKGRRVRLLLQKRRFFFSSLCHDDKVLTCHFERSFFRSCQILVTRTLSFLIFNGCCQRAREVIMVVARSPLWLVAFSESRKRICTSSRPSGQRQERQQLLASF